MSGATDRGRYIARINRTARRRNYLLAHEEQALARYGMPDLT